MNKSETKIYYLYIAVSLVFIIATTNYLSLHDIIHVANQTDVISYNEIAKNAPLLNQESNIIIQNVAQRFLIPYIVGCIANFFNIDSFLVFKLFTIALIIFYLYLTNLFIKNLNLNLKVSILFFSILFLNPYIIRYHIFNPAQAHDMLFFCIGLIFSITFINKNYFINLMVSIIAIYLRQTSIALLIGSSILLLINKKIKLFIILTVLFCLSIFLTIQIGAQISSHKFPLQLAYGIIFYDFSQFEKLIRFLFLGMMPFTPLLVVFFGNINKNIKISSALTLLFVCLMMIGQPILAGPDGSINNVGRIANLCYPILACFCFYVCNFEKFVNKNYLFYTFVSGMFLWSLHPTYSIFKSFGVFRFYNY
jgi:hypothetical protein|tara:strand:- start:16937 stop:18031 length:1095 start_codon:yes stop_codon:yes gene_type:complete